MGTDLSQRVLTRLEEGSTDTEEVGSWWQPGKVQHLDLEAGEEGGERGRGGGGDRGSEAGEEGGDRGSEAGVYRRLSTYISTGGDAIPLGGVMQFVRLAYCYDQHEVFELLAERVVRTGKVRAALCQPATGLHAIIRVHFLIIPHPHS